MKLTHIVSGVYEVVASNGERILIKGSQGGKSIREINPHSYAKLLRTIAKSMEDYRHGINSTILRADADKLDSIETLKTRTRRG